MPYIKPKRQDEIDPFIEVLANSIGGIQNEGELNYIITQLLIGFMPTDYHYSDLNTAVGVLACVKTEFERRVVALYEDLKRQENGDVFPEDTKKPKPPRYTAIIGTNCDAGSVGGPDSVLPKKDL